MLVIASLAFGGATGASTAPGTLPLESAVSTSVTATAPYLPASSDRAGASSSPLPSLAGRALLDRLSVLPTRDIATFAREHPGAITKLLLNPPSARSVSGWWTLLPDDARESLIDGAPELVGNLDGIPTTLRDSANRDFLHEAIEAIESSVDSLGRAARADTEQQLHMLREIEEALVTTKGQPKRSLLSVDTAWPGRAAVAIGDLQTADYVSYLVPGMFFTVDGQMVDWTVIAQDLNDEQESWVRRLGHTDPALDGKSVATVAWIGYQTPGIMDIASLDLARSGAKFLSSAVRGIQATRTSSEPHVTLMTHSYGSTAALMALANGGVDVDSLVIIGSPGSAAQSVAEIGMPRDRVFVGEAAWDPVVNSAFFGSDPGSEAFGARTMSVAGGIDPITGDRLAAASGHLGYFDEGSEAIRNMALIGIDRGDLVTDGTSGSSGTLTARGR